MFPRGAFGPLLRGELDAAGDGVGTVRRTRIAGARPAQPVEMAPIYVLLASTESSYVTGMIYGARAGQLLP